MALPFNYQIRFLILSSCLSEKAMATHSSTLAWKTPWTEEAGRLQSMGLWRVRHKWTTSFHTLEKEMAAHSSVLAWRTPGTVGPGELPSMGSLRIGHNWSNLAAAAFCLLHTVPWMGHCVACLLLSSMTILRFRSSCCIYQFMSFYSWTVLHCRNIS